MTEQETHNKAVTTPHTIVQHFKRDMQDYSDPFIYLYEVICVANDTTDLEKRYVVYRALYGDFKYCARPYDEFVSEVDRIKYPDAKQKLRFDKFSDPVRITPNTGKITTYHDNN